MNIKEETSGKLFAAELTEKPWDNENRDRYYGLRKGDLVELQFFNSDKNMAEVVDYCHGDNNRVVVKNTWNGEVMEYVAEWCKLHTKHEDRIKIYNGFPIYKDRLSPGDLDAIVTEKDVEMFLAYEEGSIDSSGVYEKDQVPDDYYKQVEKIVRANIGQTVGHTAVEIAKYAFKDEKKYGKLENLMQMHLEGYSIYFDPNY